MAEIFKFPSLDDRMVEQIEPGLMQIVTVGRDVAREHLKRFYPELYREYGEQATNVLALLIFRTVTELGYLKIIEELGSREKYEIIYRRLLENK